MSFRSPRETTKAESYVFQLIDKVKGRLPQQFIDKTKERLPKSRAVYLVPALIIAGFLVTASFQPNACAVLVDGQEVAVVKDKAFAENVLDDTYANLSSEQEVFTEKEVEYKKIRQKGKDLVSESELRQIYLAELDFSVHAVAITVDGKPACWVKDEAAAEEVLKKFKAGFSREGAELLSLKYENAIAYEEGTAAPGKIMDCDSVVSLLTTGTDKIVKHTVAEGESLWLIARNNDTHVVDILNANPGLTEDSVLPVGGEINLTKSEPIVHVVAVYKKGVPTIIPFETKYVKDSKLAAGQTKVKQQGQNGEKKIVYRFKTRDGVKVGQEKLGVTIIKEPVDKIVAAGERAILASRGTKSRSSGSGGGGGGSLLWPARGRISQGYRSGHRAIDIDGDSGDPVIASSGGTVSFAGYSGGYGKCIIINHGNGTSTRYAHCSSLSVSAGDHVSSGEVIGRVGSTGRSTGSHLHFEVIVNGTPRNPTNYLR